MVRSQAQKLGRNARPLTILGGMLVDSFSTENGPFDGVAVGSLRLGDTFLFHKNMMYATPILSLGSVTKHFVSQYYSAIHPDSSKLCDLEGWSPDEMRIFIHVWERVFKFGLAESSLRPGCGKMIFSVLH